MAEPERTTVEEQRAWYQKDLEAVENELMVVLRKHWPNVGSQLIANAILETAGNVVAAIVASDPTTKTAMELKVADLQLFVSTTNQPPQ